MSLKDYILSLSNDRTTERRFMVEKIAQACGVHPSTVYKWINGSTHPDILKLEKISQVTGIEVGKLFAEENENH